MSQTLDFESDQFLELLTEALRAGPGSPAWREAVGRLQEAAIGGDADEMKLLLTAREHLESGKSYRQIRAGPGFTRKVMEAVEQADQSPRRNIPMATVVAMISIAVVLVATGLLIVFLVASKQSHPPSLSDLAALNFNRPTMTETFDGGLPDGWKPIGSVAMKFDGGLSPAAAPAGTGQRVGGGLYIAAGDSASQSMEFEVTLRLPAEGQTIPQVFVSDQPDFSADRGTTPHEIAWTLNRPEESAPQVALPDGTLQGGGQAIGEAPGNYVVAIKLNANFVTVSGDGKTLYAGPNLLGPKPWYPGIRFLCRPGAAPDGTAVVMARIIKAGQ